MNKVNEKADRINGFFPITALMAMLSSIGWLFFCITERKKQTAPTEGIIGHLFSSNTAIYFSSLLLLGIVLLVVRFVSGYIPKRFSEFTEKALPKRICQIISFIIIGIILALLTRRFFISEMTEFGVDPSTLLNHQANPGTVVILSIVFVFLGIVFEKVRIPDWILYFFYTLSAVLVYYTIFFTDPLAVDSHHSTAYTESIINVYYGTPYDSMTTGIYGHYALFYAPFLHIFGAKPDTIFFLIAAFGVLADIFLIYIIHNISENNYLRISAVFAANLTIIVLRPCFYWQVQPHRTLFPCAIIAYLMYMAKNKKYSFKYQLLGYIIGSMSFIWNTETGLFCIAGFAASMLCVKLQNSRWCTKEFGLEMLTNVLLAAASCILGLLVVNIYNIACGGSFILKDYFYPLFESGYINDGLRYDMIIENSAWIYALVLFFILILSGLKKTTLFSLNTDEPLMPVMIGTSLMGLMNFSYYANRAAYFNLDIIIYPAIIATLILFEKYIPVLKTIRLESTSISNVMRASMSAVSYFVIVTMASQCIVFAMPVIESRVENGQMKSNGLQEKAEIVNSFVPENTFAFGNGANILYMQLGWETGAHYRDYSDFYLSGNDVEEKLINDALEHDDFVNFGTEVASKIVEADPRYRCVHAVMIMYNYSMPLEYFSRKYDNIEQFRETVQPDSYVFGRNISGLCNTLNWSKEAFFDLNKTEEDMDPISKIIDNARQFDSFALISGFEGEDAVIDELTKPENGYILFSQFSVSEFNISYYVKWKKLVTVEEVLDTITDVQVSGDSVFEILGCCDGKIVPETTIKIDIELEEPLDPESAQLIVDLYGGAAYDFWETERDILVPLSSSKSFSLLLDTCTFDTEACNPPAHLRLMATSNKPINVKKLTVSRVSIPEIMQAE